MCQLPDDDFDVFFFSTLYFVVSYLRSQFTLIRKLMDDLEEEMADISKEQVSDHSLLHKSSVLIVFVFIENVDRHREELHELIQKEFERQNKLRRRSGYC